MNIALYADETVYDLNIDALCERLDDVCRTLTFHRGRSEVHIQPPIKAPQVYRQLGQRIRSEAASHDLTIFATRHRYSNNYFFASDGAMVVLSFSEWQSLTPLPVANGLVYFIASLVVQMAGIGTSHDDSIGCVNDFLWDKRDVDGGMRAAYVCTQCAEAASPTTKPLLDDVVAMLDYVGRAARAELDIVELLETDRPDTDHHTFDVFLCHNSDDRSAVRKLNAALRSHGVRTWLDEEQLELGFSWQVQLEEIIAKVRGAMVLIGPSGVAPWQDLEMRAFLMEVARRQCPVIPTLLPKTPDVPDLPLFLRQMQWIDLRDGYDRQIDRLVDFFERRRHGA